LLNLAKFVIMYIQRTVLDRFVRKTVPGKVVTLYGPRRTGKTTFIKNYLETVEGKLFRSTGDDLQLREVLTSQNKSRIIQSFSGYDLIFIDEAQRIPDIGWGIKLLIDEYPSLKIILTGSSSFELASEVNEPLTGRSWTVKLYPFSSQELINWLGTMEYLSLLDNYLIFGTYPETVTASGFAEKREYLSELKNAYLFKDILELENIRNASKITDLLKLLAFQIGNEVSLNELSNALGIAKQTVERYLNLLELTFVIKKVSGFSRNLRKEVTKTARYYFFDNGIRNALINNFNMPESRNDMGQLWENYCVIERLKKQEYTPVFSNNYFWRTYDQQEVDWVEEREGHLYGYEFKWNPKKLIKAPKAWTQAYPEASFKPITPDNMLEFI